MVYIIMYEEESLIIQVNELKKENECMKKEIEELKAYLKRYMHVAKSIFRNIEKNINKDS